MFFIAGWAISQILGAGFAINWIAWFLGAALLHDLVLLPLYSALDRGLHDGRTHRGARDWLTSGTRVSGSGHRRSTICGSRRSSQGSCCWSTSR